MPRINSWTKQQDELLLRLYPTYRPACIAIFLGRTRGAVMTRHWFLRRQRKTVALVAGLAKLPPRLSCPVPDRPDVLSHKLKTDPIKGQNPSHATGSAPCKTKRERGTQATTLQHPINRRLADP
jgi:hypothetical protein